MKRVWTVTRAELRSYLDHPTAYVLVIGFLSLALFLSVRQIYVSGMASLRPLFDLLPWLFTVFVPAVAMRSLAEERRGRTIEWLLAQPIDEAELVAGKLIGTWIMVLLAIVGTVPAAIAIILLSDADPGVVVGQYAGAALMAAQLAAIGVWSSSVTKNQITAFILGTGVCLFFLMLGTPIVQMGLPSVLAEPALRLSLFGHFDNVTRGVLDLRDILYFASVTGLFGLLAYVTVARERLSLSKPAYKRLRLGAAALAAAVLVLNLLGGYVRGRVDLTSGNLYTLSEGTRDIVGGLDDVVTIRLFISGELPPEVQISVRDVRDLLGDIARASAGQVRVQETNPDDDPEAAEEAQGYGIEQIEFNVLRNDEFTVRNGWFGLAMLYADRSEVIPVIDRTEDLEYRLLSAISRMTTDVRPVVAFLSGFGSRGGQEMGILYQVLSERYEIAEVNLETDSVPTLSPEQYRVIVVAGPSLPMDPAAIAAIEAYLDAGGGGLFLMDRNQVSGEMLIAQEALTGLESLLEARGVRVAPGIVYDLRSFELIRGAGQGPFPVVQPYPYWPIVFPGEPHPTNRNLSNMSMGWASPLEIVEGSGAVPLWTTTDAAGLQDSGTPVDPSIPGSFSQEPGDLAVRVIAAAVSSPEADAGAETGGGVPGRIVVVGDVDFLSANFVQAGTVQNLYFGANAVDWLAQDEALISIRAKDRMPPPLVFPSDGVRRTTRWGSLVGVPVLFALFGLLRVGGRKRRAERRWAGVLK